MTLNLDQKSVKLPQMLNIQGISMKTNKMFEEIETLGYILLL